MKKILFFLGIIAMVCCACNKSCTCTISNTNQDMEIEVAYNDNCSEQSNDNRTCK